MTPEEITSECTERLTQFENVIDTYKKKPEIVTKALEVGLGIGVQLLQYRATMTLAAEVSDIKVSIEKLIEGIKNKRMG